MHSIAIKKTRIATLLALIFFGIGLAEAQPIAHGQKANIAPWRTLEWLTNQATVFTNAGRSWLTSKIDESVQTTADYGGWGTGTTTAAVTQTALVTEDTGGSPTYARQTATRSVVTTSVTNDTVQWVVSITSNGAHTIAEAGLFTAVTSGTMIMRGDFTGVVLALNDVIQFTWQLQLT